jgi:hypothetical protein
VKAANVNTLYSLKKEYSNPGPRIGLVDAQDAGYLALSQLVRTGEKASHDVKQQHSRIVLTNH